MSRKDPTVIFGAGAGGRRAATHFARTRDVLFFVDSSPARHGQRVLDWDVRPPSAVLTVPAASVVVASVYADEIFAQLVTLGVPAQKVEIVNPDSLLDGGRDPFPVGCAAIIGVLTLIMSALVWWLSHE